MGILHLVRMFIADVLVVFALFLKREAWPEGQTSGVVSAEL